MIDSHCHFDFPPFSDNPERYLTEARKAGVDTLIVPAIGRKNWQSVAKLASNHAEIYFALGLHPYFMADHQTGDIDALRLVLSEPSDICDGSDSTGVLNKCVAVGECGLDFSLTTADKKQQLTMLEAQLDIAQTVDLPVILHSRRSHNELLTVLKHFPAVTGVLHAFSGSYEQGKQFIDRGLKLGIGGTITYERANKTRIAVAKLPLDAMVLETDAPDMPLAGQQGKPNLPSYLPQVAEMLSALKMLNFEDIVTRTSSNSRQVFGIV